jgi:uncharacterized protein
LLTLITIFLIVFGVFMYKVKYGMPFYETEKPALSLQKDDFNVLVFYKTNGFNHSDAIEEASLPALDQLASDNNWHLFKTNEGGVFNPDQLSLFDVVVWNNTSGRVLTDEQRTAFKDYVENGGGFVGIHAAGDASHHWDWYYDNLISTTFSHHPIKEHLQANTIILQPDVDSSLALGLAPSFEHTDEWYVFNSNPADNGASIIYAMDGEKINPDGNMLWIKDKDFGMGKFHPNMWYKSVGKGKAFYSAMGHTKKTFENEHFLKALSNGINWAGKAN